MTQQDPNPRFLSGDHHQPEVMKAILLNSADKLEGVHASRRDVVTTGNVKWTDTAAYATSFQSLDDEIGAGHLNAGNALRNLQPGEYSPGTVAPIGWDYGSVASFGGFLDYAFEEPVSGYVAVTLAWNRVWEKTGPQSSYSGADVFFNPSLNDLDLFLIDTNTNNIVRSSTTTGDNLEHIFFEVPSGDYKIRVQHSQGNDDQDFGLAWWAGEITTPGDFNSDGSVDGQDFLAWQRNPSIGDLGDWQSNYGTGTLAASGAGSSSIAQGSSPQIIGKETRSPQTMEEGFGTPQSMSSAIGGGFSLQIKEASTGPEDVGTLEIVYTGDEENYSFANGGISLELESLDPGVIEFDEARILNGDNRWTWTASPSVGLDTVENLLAFSVLTPGLAGEGTRVFAEVDYYLVGQGSTELQLLLSGLDPLIDGGYGDVSQLVSLVGMWLGDGQSNFTAVPEPGGMLLAVQLAWLFGAKRSNRT